MDNLSRAQEWHKFAEMDLNSAKHLVNMRPTPPLEVICYHCQQAAEKYLKGFLVLNSVKPPRTHDLDYLCRLCSGIADKFHNIADDCSDLTAFGVKARYPLQIKLEDIDMRQALYSAKSIRDFVHTLAPELNKDKPLKFSYREMIAALPVR